MEWIILTISVVGLILLIIYVRETTKKDDTIEPYYIKKDSDSEKGVVYDDSKALEAIERIERVERYLKDVREYWESKLKNTSNGQTK
jgi:hypothetical protein